MDVKERISAQLDTMFESAPQSRAAYELREELLANCMARYDDLVRQGTDSEAAIKQVMNNIGNVDELIAALPGELAPINNIVTEQQQRKSAMMTAIAIGLYIFAGAVFFIGAALGGYNHNAVLIGLVVAILICIVPTMMLVYNAHRHPRYQKNDDTVVENFKQWTNDAGKAKSLRAAIDSILWTVTVAVYLLISFTTWQWHITWIIFPIALCVQAVINLLFKLRELK